MENWWNRYPDALEAEKSALDALGYPWSIDEAAKQVGRLVIHLEVPHGGSSVKLTAKYPDTFPYFQPQVFLDEVTFRRHQHPLGKNLCLLAREGEQWQPGKDTLAVLLREQLPLIQSVNATDASSTIVADNEDHVGEPFASFLSYPLNCSIIVPDKTPPLGHTVGRLTLLVRPRPQQLAENPFVNGIVRTIFDLGQKPLVEFPTTIPAFSEKMSGFWTRLPERPRPDTTQNLEQHFFNLINSNVPEFNKALNKANRGQAFIAGFVYPDETTWRKSSDDWVFLAVQVSREAKRSRPADVRLWFIRADWGGEDAWMRRAPALRPLRAKSALVVGLGSLGSPLVLHLARAGISHLHLVDCDYLQVGNTVRWALGWQYSGFPKVAALANHLWNEYPYTEVGVHHMRTGASPDASDQSFSDYQVIRSIAEKVDLIIDASANHRVSHFLADLAAELDKPYLWLTTTHGAAGGVVGRIVPKKTSGCWHCFQHSLADKTIRLPADAGSDEIQPGGCSQPTFVGAGIDSDEIALLAARFAVATLSSGESGGYPDFTWDVAVGDLARNGNSIAPDWTPYTLTTKASCPACSRK